MNEETRRVLLEIADQFDACADSSEGVWRRGSDHFYLGRASARRQDAEYLRKWAGGQQGKQDENGGRRVYQVVEKPCHCVEACEHRFWRPGDPVCGECGAKAQYIYEECRSHCIHVPECPQKPKAVK